MGKDFNTWSIDQLKETPADTGKVFQLMTELFSIQPVKKLESTKDESAMGLGENARKLETIRFERSNDSILNLGQKQPQKVELISK